LSTTKPSRGIARDRDEQRHRLGRAGTAIVLVILGLVGGFLTASPAQAAPGDTTVTFGVLAGGLSISVPASANLGTGAPGSVISGQLGTVTVTDQRGLLVAIWTSTASTTVFKTGGGTAAETVGKASVSYFSGAATTVSGLNLTIGGVLLGIANALPLTVPINAVAISAGVGNNVVSWNPTVVVTVPSTAVAGTYTGTITHSVA
jgi:hypothetical protein